MSKRNIGLLAFLIVVFLLIGIWIIEIIHGEVPYVDQWTRSLVAKFPDTMVYGFFLTLTNLGSKQFVIPFAATMVVVLIVLYRDWFPGVLYGLAILITRELNSLIKGLVHRERPSILVEANAVGESFPSGHAMVSFVCYGLLAYFLTKKIKSKKRALFVQVFFAFLVFLIGISRFVINVHYLTDIVAGFAFGFICLLIFIFVFEWVQKKRSRS